MIKLGKLVILRVVAKVSGTVDVSYGGLLKALREERGERDCVGGLSTRGLGVRA